MGQDLTHSLQECHQVRITEVAETPLFPDQIVDISWLEILHCTVEELFNTRDLLLCLLNLVLRWFQQMHRFKLIYEQEF